MFPAIDTSNTNPIYWSGPAGGFRQEGTAGRISNISGVQSLTLSDVNGVMRYRDALGHFAPDPVSLNYPALSYSFVNTNRTLTPVGASVYDKPPGQNAYYVTFGIYTADDGTVRMTSIANKVGGVMDFADEQRRLAGAIAHDLGIPLGAEGSDKILARASMLLHYAAR